MRRRLHRLAALTAFIAVLVPALLTWSGATTESRDRLADMLLADPPVSRDLAVVGIADPRLWPVPPTGPGVDGLDSDRLRFRALVRTLEAVLEHEPRLVVMTDVVTNEDLTAEDAAALVAVLASGRVLMPYLDDVPVADNGDGDAVRRFRRPLSVTAGLPLAHAVVDQVGPGDRVRTIAVEEPWSADGEDYDFVALPVAALASVATVPVARDDTSLRAGGTTIPLENGRLRINFTDRLVDRVAGTTTPRAMRDDAPFVSGAQLARGDADVGDMLTGRIVLVGSVDPLQASYVPVPGGPTTGIPEVWVHANAVNTVLVDAPLSPARPFELALWLVAVVGAVTLLALRRPPVEAGVWLVPLALVALVAVTVRGGAGVIVDGTAVLLAMLLAWVGTVVVRQAVEGRQRRRVALLFRRYVPDEVASQLLEDEVDLEALAAGTRAHVTVLFCDLRGFTAQAGRLDPGHVRDLLNIYYRHATGVILEHNGTVMQYVGDEVFAVFGAPLPQHDHVARAVAAARELQDAVGDIAVDLGELGVGPIQYGIGVHTGPVVAAHVGDAARTQYAVVGDTVNVGARLCSQALAGEIVVSEDVLGALPRRPPTVSLGSVPLKGVERDLPIHRLRHDSATHVPEG